MSSQPGELAPLLQWNGRPSEMPNLDALLAPASPAELAHRVTEAWAAVVDASSACLLLPRERPRRLAVVCCLGEQRAIDALVPVAERMLGLETPMLVNDGAHLVQPLGRPGDPIAILAAARTGDVFRRRDLELAREAAPRARIALEHVRLVDRVLALDGVAALGQLAAGIAHELRNPLSVLVENNRAACQTLTELSAMLACPPGTNDPQQLRASMAAAAAMVTRLRAEADDSMECTARMRDMVRDVRELSSPAEMTLLPVALNAAIDSALRMCRSDLAGRVRVTRRLGDDTVVTGSLGRLSQVFVNLLVNAAQAIEAAGRGQGTVTISTARVGDRVVAEVADDGPGIAPDALSRIFDPFFTTKGEAEGTGLGLFLCRDIIERHGGSVAVRSSPTGTVFTVSLPGSQRRA